MNGSTTILKNVIIHDNRGGIWNTEGSKLSLTNVVISNNNCQSNYQGPSYCGAMFALINSGEALLTNVTITNNRFYDFTEYYDGKNDHISPSGIENTDGGTLKMINSIVANNLGFLGYDCMGEITSLGHNILGSDQYCQFNRAEGDIVGNWMEHVEPLVNSHPMPYGDIQTLPLLTGSPAINSGDPAACPETDQRGVPRPEGAGCDRGAYEGSLDLAPAPVVVTLSSENTTYFPGVYICETPVEDCTGGTDPNADLAHRYAIDAYRMFFDRYGRNSMDDAGMAVLSTVHAGGDAGVFWNGRQLTYSDYFVVDDIGVHEYAHGVNQYSSRLFNYYQSGAISESLGDMWGEYYDQTNGMGTDTPEVKWLIGEDLEEGAIRSMSNPPQYKHPDRLGSTYYSFKPTDNGGIHINNGVNNKAVYLLVEGGKFNKVTISPIGWDKVLGIYYYAQTHLLTSGAGYDDLYAAVNQACAGMTGGSEGITADDCMQVRKALDAVEMKKAHKSSFNPDASVCPSGKYQVPNYLFHDDFENGDSNWIFEAISGNSRWSLAPGDVHITYAASGDYALFGNDFDATIDREEQVSDTFAAMANGVYIPPGSQPVLYFNHSFGFEHYPPKKTKYYFDGGVLEYSIDDGVNWLDAKSLFDAGTKYTGKLYNGKYAGFNPLRNRYAFRGESHGYVSSRYDLSKLAGKTVRFRWRLGTDYTGGFLGWVVDDVAIYTCVGKPATPSLASPSSGSLLTSYEHVRLDWKNATYAAIYDVQIAADSKFTTLLQQIDGLSQSEYTFSEPLTPDRRYYWRVRAINAVGMYGKWSSARYFRTGMTPPLLAAPENDATTTALRPTFQWSGPAAAKSYLLQVSKYASLSKPVFSTTVKTTSFTPSKNLTPATRYYWRVKANGTNPSGWSQVFTFTTP